MGDISMPELPRPARPVNHQPPTLRDCAYPHIIESIIAHASSRTLLRLRETCKAFELEADRRLLAHAILEGTLSSLDLKGAAFSLARANNVRVLDVHPRPTVGKSVLCRVRASLLGAPIAISDCDAHFTHARTVRLFLDDSRSPSIKCRPWRVVLFADETSNIDVTLPQGVRRVVLNLRPCPWARQTVPHIPRGTQFANVVHDLNDDVPETLGWLLAASPEAEVTVVGAPVELVLPWVACHLEDSGRDPKAANEIVSRVNFETWDEFRRSSPHFGLETEVGYRLSVEEVEALVRDDERAVEALGL